jgi:hypothetical protein
MRRKPPRFEPRCRFCTGIQALEGVCRWHEENVYGPILQRVEAKEQFRLFCSTPVQPQDVRH